MGGGVQRRTGCKSYIGRAPPILKPCRGPVSSSPEVVFLSHSIFGSSNRASAQRTRQAHALFRERASATADVRRGRRAAGIRRHTGRW